MNNKQTPEQYVSRAIDLIERIIKADRLDLLHIRSFSTDLVITRSFSTDLVNRSVINYQTLTLLFYIPTTSEEGYIDLRIKDGYHDLEILHHRTTDLELVRRSFKLWNNLLPAFIQHCMVSNDNYIDSVLDFMKEQPTTRLNN